VLLERGHEYSLVGMGGGGVDGSELDRKTQIQAKIGIDPGVLLGSKGKGFRAVVPRDP